MRVICNKDGELLDYLCNNLDMPRKRIKQYLVHGSIYINDRKVTKYNYHVSCGMVITIDTKNKGSLPFDIVFEDDHIIVVNKPSGLLTIATTKEKERTLYHIVREYLISKNKAARVFIVHRLDRDTSGIVILAKDKKTKDMLQKNWNEYVSLREYIGVVHGHLNKKSDCVKEYLKETRTNYVYKSHDGALAITNYSVIKENDDYSMVDIKIDTGKKNQIRVCFSSMGNPIVGDKKYNKKDGFDRLYLHAKRLKLYYPIIGKEILFETSTPGEFKRIMR